MKQCQYTSLGVPPRGRWDACAQQSKHARRCTKSIGNGKAQGTHGADGAPEGVERLQLRTRLEVRRGLRLDDLQAGKRSQVGSYLVSNECWPTILIGHAIHAAIFNESKLYMDYTWNTNPKKLEARCTEIRETTAKTSRNFKFRKQGFLAMRFEVSAARVSNFSEYHQIVSGRHLTRFQCQMGIVSSNSRNWALRRQDVSPPQNRSVCVMFASALEPCKMRYTAGTVAQKRFQPLIQSQQIYSICFSIHSECTKMR